MKTKIFEGVRNFAINDFKAAETDGKLVISGYANNKYIADSYGDVPTPYNRDYVYDLKRYLKNPVILLNHETNTNNLIGKCTEIYEDERGLFFKAELSASEFAPIKHAKTLIKEGILKTLSIGGRWHYEDASDLNKLTLAEIYEISLVAIPADENATLQTVQEVNETPNLSAEIAAQKISEINGKLSVYQLNDKLNNFAVKK